MPTLMVKQAQAHRRTDLQRNEQRGYASGEGRSAGILCAGAESLCRPQRLLCTLDPLRSG
jgi:hypothetical protein